MIASRRLSARASLLCWLVLVAACVVEWTWPGATFAQRAFLNFIITAVVAVGKFLWDVAQTVGVKVIWAVVRNLGRGLEWVARWSGKIAQATGTFFARTVKLFKGFYRDVIRPAVLTLTRWFRMLQGKLRRWFGPVLKFLEDVRVEVLKFYKKWIRPVLDTIDVARFVTRTLARFDVEWAKKLDAKLEQIQGIVTRNFTLLLSYINRAIDALNDIIDVTGALKRIPLIRALLNYRSEWMAIWWAATHRDLTPAEKASATSPIETKPLAFHVVELKAAIAGRSDELAPKIREHVADLKLMLQTIR